MARQTTLLDGPRMGYGPGPQQRRGAVPLSTVILGIVCLLLAGVLALSIAGRHQPSPAASTGTASQSADPTGDVSVPAGVVDTVAAFMSAWALAPAERDNKLAAVNTTGLGRTVNAATSATLAKGSTGDPVITRVDDQTIHAAQTLTDGSTVQLQLVFDQAAVYGWLVSSVQLT